MLLSLCQLLSLPLLLAAVSMGLAPNQALGQSLGPTALAEEIDENLWYLAGWLTEPGGQSAGAQWRSINFPDPGGGEDLRLAMFFPTASSVQAQSLELDCRLSRQSAKIRVKDGRSFGAEKIVIEILEGEDKKLDSQLDKSELERLCLSAAISSLVAGPKLEKPFFEQIEAGLKMAKVRALFGPRLGSNQIILVKASPNYFRLSPYHESEAPSWNENPVNIEGWARRLSKARVVFNGGQFYPNRSYMGLLRRSGRDISAKVHSGWKGFLVQEPSPEGQKATIIDLEASPEAKLTINQYPTVIQSFMMFDSLGRLRVRKSRLLASRAMLGIDRDGDFLLVLAPGAMTLVDLADLGAYLGLRQALGLDGGLETQLALKGPSGLRAEVGRYANNFLGNFRIDNFSPSLPSVLALEPLGEGGLD